MPSADIVLADDVVQSLQNKAFSLTFTAERMWVPEWDERDELGVLCVGVQPGLTPSGVRGDRKVFEETWPVDLHFCQRLVDKTRDELDGLAGFVEEVRKHLVGVGFEAEGMNFEPTAYEYLARFDPRPLCRERRGDKIIYSGNFLSILQVSYLRID